VLFVAGVVGLGSSLTPFPRPSQTLNSADGWRLSARASSDLWRLDARRARVVTDLVALALFGTAFLSILFELKSRHEESMLMERFPEYEAYRRRVRWWFIPGVH